MQDERWDDESWLPVVDWTGYYEVSDKGRVRSVDREIESRPGVIQRFRGQILRPCKDAKGYDRVMLCRKGFQRSFTVHTLVAAAFLGPRPPGHVIRHGPLGKEDNTPENLRYRTSRQNVRDRDRDGTTAEGEKCFHAKLTALQAFQIRVKSWEHGRPPLRVIAEEYGVSIQCVWSIAHWRTWTHLPVPGTPESEDFLEIHDFQSVEGS